MTTPKYEFTGETRGKLNRIRRLSDGALGGWIEHEVRGMDREDVLLKLLGLMEVTVKYHGTHWVNGKQYPWEVVNRV